MPSPEYNKKYNCHHKPFPVRLGHMKEIIMEDAFDSDQSIHWCIIRAVEVYYAAAMVKKAQDENHRFEEVLQMLSEEYTLKEVLVKLCVPEKLLILGITEAQRRELYKLLTHAEISGLQQKVGYYNSILKLTP